MCYLSWMVGHFQRYQRYHKLIFIYADLDHQGPYCDNQDSLCDHLFYANLESKSWITHTIASMSDCIPITVLT